MSELLQEVEKERAREREWAEKSEQIERLPLAVLYYRDARWRGSTREPARYSASSSREVILLRKLAEDPGGIQGSRMVVG